MSVIESELDQIKKQLIYERFISDLLYNIVSDEHGERCSDPSEYYDRVELAKTAWEQNRNYIKLQSENECLKEQVEISMRLVRMQKKQIIATN